MYIVGIGKKLFVKEGMFGHQVNITNKGGCELKISPKAVVGIGLL